MKQSATNAEVLLNELAFHLREAFRHIAEAQRIARHEYQCTDERMQSFFQSDLKVASRAIDRTFCTYFPPDIKLQRAQGNDLDTPNETKTESF